VFVPARDVPPNTVVVAAVIGLAVIIGGSVLSGFGASTCQSNVHDFFDNPHLECAAIGFVGTLGSVALGTTIFAVGLHGELRVTRTIAVAPTSLVLRF